MRTPMANMLTLYLPLTKSLAIRWVQSRKDDPSRLSFLDLPKELRNNIYDFMFRVHGAIFIYCSDAYAWRSALKAKIVKYKNEGPSEPQQVGGVIAANLLLTSRQLYAEGADVLYGKNLFRFYVNSANFAPSSYHLVRHVAFTIEAGTGIYEPNLEVMSYWWRYLCCFFSWTLWLIIDIEEFSGPMS